MRACDHQKTSMRGLSLKPRPARLRPWENNGRAEPTLPIMRGIDASFQIAIGARTLDGTTVTTQGLQMFCLWLAGSSLFKPEP